MGDFGIHLYENDFALDIKNRYEDGLNEGLANKEITKHLMDYYSDERDIYYQMMFWVILADVQLKHGKLLKTVKDNALRYLNDDDLLERCLVDTEFLKDIRKNEILEVKNRLNNPTNKIKRIKNTFCICEWNVGDVFEYQLHEYDSLEYKGSYIYLVICDKICHLENLCPVVYIFAGVFKNKQCLDELKNVDFLPEPIIRACEKSSVDFTYRLLLFASSKRCIPFKFLNYLGNIGEVFKDINEKKLKNGEISYRLLLWEKIDWYFINAWNSWSRNISNGKIDKSNISKFRGRIAQNEDYVRVFCGKSSYRAESDILRFKVSKQYEQDYLRIYPFLWSFTIIAEMKEFHDAKMFNGARYKFLYCKAKDINFEYVERDLIIPQSINDNIYIDIYSSHSKEIYYCDFSKDFICEAYYDKNKNIYAVGNPEGIGRCIEFSTGQYALINLTKLVAIFIDLNITHL